MKTTLRSMSKLAYVGILALSTGSVSIARAEVQRSDFRIEADLLQAAAQGDSVRVRDLLGKGANIEVRDGQNTWTPLMWASRSGHLATIRVLIARGARVNARSVGSAKTYIPLAQGRTQAAQTPAAADAMTPTAPPVAGSIFLSANNGITPLMLASVGGFNLSAKELLNKGANVNARTSSGETALEAAAFKGYLPLVQTLIARGAQVNNRNGKGQTPLLMAIMEAQSPVVKLLLSKGADANIPNTAGYSALSMARYYGYKDMERMLVRAGAVMRPATPKTAAASKTPPRKVAPAKTQTTRRNGAPSASGSDILVLN